jgi:hypothetical protein
MQAGLWHHLSFHGGRLLTYGFLGALGAGIFYAVNAALFFKTFRGGMTLISGLLMLLLGLFLLRILPLPKAFTDSIATSGPWWGRRLNPLFKSQRIGSKIILGLATGFLPCGLSWAMIAKAASTQSILGGFFTMAAFGLGTVPALFLTGLSTSFFSYKVRLLGDRVAAAAVIVMGLILVFKGARVLV